MAADKNFDAPDRTAFEKATIEACNVFGIPALYDKQKEALENFFSGRDVFVNLPTCYGKSLIFKLYRSWQILFSKGAEKAVQ